ncbi:DUF4231 domain-containing protein [Micromonospora chersina]|uniref:DUF4231 domain-containing protein n=1 Tax=Micromonospora chersina TaxID=47854 RepID=UPI00371CE540
MELTDTDLPSVFRDADRAAKQAQRGTLRWTLVRLTGAVAAAIGGAISLALFGKEWAGAISALGFGAALVAEFVLLQSGYERSWYQSRASAESLKTIAWRYAVAADPFPASLPPAKTDQLLANRIRDVLRATGTAGGVNASADLLPPQLIKVRRSSFEERRHVYLRDRLQNQLAWYSRESDRNRRRSAYFRAGLVMGEVVAVVFSVLRFSGVIKVDLAGIFAAMVAAAASWLAVRQFESLATAYALAGQELTTLQVLIGATEEPRWSQVVADAEEAISREHTTWQASRRVVPHQRSA